MISTVPVIENCLPLLSRYPGVICDIWGVLHDGILAFDGSNETLTRYREQGGEVVLLSNSPQVSWQIENLLERKKVVRSVYDSIVTSGDITIRVVNQLGLRKVFHVGPGRHDPLYDKQPYARTALEEAEGIICTGFYDDDYENMAPYAPILEQAHARNLPFVCANPDLIVDVGGTLFPCAGILAQKYEAMGGTVHWAGKPHRLAFEMAMASFKKKVSSSDLLMIGDTLRTDVAGAKAAGIDALFIAQGIHKHEIAPHGTIDSQSLTKLVAESGTLPNAAAFSLQP